MWIGIIDIQYLAIQPYRRTKIKIVYRWRCIKLLEVINGSSDRGKNHQHNRMINKDRLLHLSSSGIAFQRVTGFLVFSLFFSFSCSSCSIPAAFVEVVPQSRSLYLALAFCYSHFRESFRCHRQNETGVSKNFCYTVRNTFKGCLQYY